MLCRIWNLTFFFNQPTRFQNIHSCRLYRYCNNVIVKINKLTRNIMTENTNIFNCEHQVLNKAEHKSQFLTNRGFLVCILESTNCKSTRPFNMWMHSQRSNWSYCEFYLPWQKTFVPEQPYPLGKQYYLERGQIRQMAEKRGSVKCSAFEKFQ